MLEQRSRRRRQKVIVLRFLIIFVKLVQAGVKAQLAFIATISQMSLIVCAISAKRVYLLAMLIRHTHAEPEKVIVACGTRRHVQSTIVKEMKLLQLCAIQQQFPFCLLLMTQVSCQENTNFQAWQALLIILSL